LGGREVTKKGRRVVVAKTREDLLLRALAAARNRIFLSLLGKGEIFPLANQGPGPLRRGVLKFR
jgi:hypothetical protein